MVMEKQNQEYDVLQNKLNMLRKNREMLSEEELQGRYAKAYGKLKSDIIDLLNDMQKTELSRILLPKKVMANNMQAIKDCYTIYLQRIKDVAFTQYNVEAMMQIWREFQSRMLQDFGATVDLSYLMEMDDE